MMKLVSKQFAEFRSIFKSGNLLEENEEHANIVTASTMLNLFWMCLITWLLVYLNVFKVGKETINLVLYASIAFLFVPAAICYIKEGKGKWLKQLLFLCFVLMMATADAILKYNVTLVMVIPIILAARYYNKRFTIGIGVLTSIAFIFSAILSIGIGQQDLNTYNLIIPEGTVITIHGTLRDSIASLSVDESQRLFNIFIHFFLPKILVFNIIAFACAQISQSGKKMMETQKEISEAGERIDTELRLANSIQQAMLPSTFPPFPEHKEIEIYASMTPAKEVGGDFYDMFMLDDNHLAICVSDVSGKGIPAALIMMICKILIKNVSKIDMGVDKTLERVNNMLCDGNTTDIFVTTWFGILDLKTGVMKFVNAGHNPPLVYSKKENTFTYLRTKPNLVLAGLENVDYVENELVLKPGDRIFLYTDGVTEATDKHKQLYGEERLERFLNNHLQLNVEETIIGVKKDVDHFVKGEEQFDDITMLELLYKGPREVKEKKFQANIKELTRVQNFVKKELEKYNCKEAMMNEILLATEEVFVNIANYAYEGEGKCTLKVEYDDSIFHFTFEDKGIPFNPLEKKKPDLTLSAKERKIGGLGILLTKKIMDHVEYKYENEKNILMISKRI